jgi:Asp/Glu/hydantoin racemase
VRRLNRLSFCRRAGRREAGSLASRAWLEYSAIVHLNIVNPNTSAAMTRIIAAAAAKVARPGTTIRAVESAFGPASIEGFYDDAFAVPGLLARVAEGEAACVDGHVIACFDDTGLDAARALANAPVVGVGEAAFHMASLLCHRFAVVTTLSRSIPVIEHNLGRCGLDRRCARVRAADVPVLALDNPTSNARARIGDVRRAGCGWCCRRGGAGGGARSARALNLAPWRLCPAAPEGLFRHLRAVLPKR